MPTYNPQTALIVVDVQNDFADPRGALHVPGGENVVAVVNEEVRQARAAGALVVYTQDWHPPTTAHFERDGGIWPVHCVRDTWGAQLVAELDVAGPVVRKGTGGEDGYSGFTVRDPQTGATTPTGLAQLLRAGNVERVVVVGLATDYCVKETAADALAEGFATTIVGDGVRAVDRQPGDGARALEDLAQRGAQIV